MTDKVEIDIEQIKKYLPHRAPFLFVERLTDIVPEESATGWKAVSYNETHFQGHFPDFAVMPGVPPRRLRANSIRVDAAPSKSRVSAGRARTPRASPAMQSAAASKLPGPRSRQSGATTSSSTCSSTSGS